MTSGVMPITVQNKIHRCTARHITLPQKKKKPKQNRTKKDKKSYNLSTTLGKVTRIKTELFWQYLEPF